jgi:hypothetical protein
VTDSRKICAHPSAAQALEQSAQSRNPLRSERSKGRKSKSYRLSPVLRLQFGRSLRMLLHGFLQTRQSAFERPFDFIAPEVAIPLCGRLGHTDMLRCLLRNHCIVREGFLEELKLFA